MYCQHCGKEVFGNYCAHCGTKVSGGADGVTDLSWQTESDFAKIIRYPEVRNLITQYADQASQKKSAKAILSAIDLLMAPVAAVSTEKLSEIIVPFYQKIGVRTGKASQQSFDQSVQHLLVKMLCALAKNAYPLDTYQALSNGILLTAKLPSDMWTWGGDIILSIEAQEQTSVVQIATKIKGQFYDWGKSKKLIRQLFTDLETISLDEIV